MKPAPSERTWYSFTELPKMDIKITPVFMETALSWNMISDQLLTVLKNVVRRIRLLEYSADIQMSEIIVGQNQDDIAFHDTMDFFTRGLILNESARRAPDLSTDPANPVQGDVSKPTSMPTTTAEDPASAVAETSALRRRNNSRAATLGRPAANPVEVTVNSDKSLGRVDTAPAAVAGQTAAKKKWLPGVTRASLGSVSSLTDKNRSASSLTRTNSDDSAKGPASPIAVSTKNFASTVSNGTSRSAAQAANGSSQTPSISSSSTASIRTGGTAASILAPYRKGGEGRERIEDSVNKAQNTLQSWRTKFAAKPAKSSPPPVAEAPPRTSHSSETPRLSLNDRLKSVAAPPAPVPTPIDISSNRNRSTSTTSSHPSLAESSSKPALVGSPPKASLPPATISTFEPDFAVASSRLPDSAPSPPIPPVRSDSAVTQTPSETTSLTSTSAESANLIRSDSAPAAVAVLPEWKSDPPSPASRVIVMDDEDSPPRSNAEDALRKVAERNAQRKRDVVDP